MIKSKIPKERRPDGTAPGDDERMMRNPGYWPNWPYQTIKNKRETQAGGFPRLALLVEFSGPDAQAPGIDIRFVEANLYSVTPEILAKAEKCDIAKLVAEGWVVD